MRRQSVISKKKRGPPATGKGTPIMVRLQPTDLSDLDTWAATQSEQLTRPEAVRQLMRLGLTVKQKRT